MIMARKTIGLASLVMVAALSARAHATVEICGNGVDDDLNGLTDENCYSPMVTGVCESPLSCGDTGMVSWSTGSLHYDLPPDIAPQVPYGPGIGLRRFATPSYLPAGAAPSSVNHQPMGPGWQHTYMTWLYRHVDNDGHTRITLHTSQGRDVLYTMGTANGCIEPYTPQAGDHVMSLQNDTCKQVTTVQLLTGETLLYNGFGQLYQIQDTLPTPNVVAITWTGTSNGSVSTVTDASLTRRLNFVYTNNLLTSVQYQFCTANCTTQTPTWLTQHTTTYDYSNYVTRDATSGWFVPANATEWTNLLTGSGIPNPTNLWGCQETSGNLGDSIGSAPLAPFGFVSYANSVSGWSRTAVHFGGGSTAYFQSSASICNPATTACTALGIMRLEGVPPSNTGDFMVMGDANGARAMYVVISSVAYLKELWDSANSATTPYSTDSLFHPFILVSDPANSTTTLQNDTVSVIPTWAAGTSASGVISIGGAVDGADQMSCVYLAEWSGTALNSTQRTTLIGKVKNGPGILTTVTIGGQLAQQYSYTNGLLTQIRDGGGTQVVAFGYSSTTTGQVDLVTTSRGTVGFEYSPSRTGCTGSGKTALYFNQGNTLSCNVDGDCGTGYMCGGKTGTGSTGKCFLAGRCLTLTDGGVLNGEKVVSTVAPLGPGGGSCSGACTDVMAYSWSALGTGNINVVGREDPATNFTSAVYNSNGLPYQIGYGDSDADPTNSGANRTEYISYDSQFPGRIAQIRRVSDNPPSGTSCTSQVSTGCESTTYCYGSSCATGCASDNQLCTITQAGFTLDATGAVVSYTNLTKYIRDAKGRIAEIDGPVSGIATTFTYNVPTPGSLDADMLSSVTINTGNSLESLTTFVTTHDFFGHATAVQDPNGKFTCDSYESARGMLTSRTRSMGGQTDCSHPNVDLDIKTSFARDSWERLTQLTLPDGTCVFYTYDSSGRPNQIKRRDDCNQNSSGDYQQYVYTADGQVSEIDTYDSSNNLTAKQPYTYFASRRLQEIVNPVNTSQFTGMVYDSAGKVTEIDGAGSLAKTINHYDGTPGRDGRITSVDRFKTSTTFDTWSLLYAWLGDQSQVTDGDSKVTGSTRDDLGRLVKISSPDLAASTVRVFDAASRLTTIVEDLGGASQRTHSFTYDSMSRQTVADYAPRCTPQAGNQNHAITQRSYDVLPSGVSCPAGMTNHCANIKGHLAYVQQVLLCETVDLNNYPDGSHDQFTFYAYDDAGRLIEEYITDDTVPTARIDHLYYTYRRNGDLWSVTTPSALGILYSFGSVNSNSDGDLVSSISVNGSNVIDTVQWSPFGPWKQYNWEATIGGTGLRNRVARNLAYRITTVFGAELQSGASNNAQVAITEDAMGRVTSRSFTPAVTGLQNSFFTYDEQSRVTCESAASGTCPTSGANLKNNHDLSFKNAGDWKEILRPIAGSTNGTINNVNTSGTTYGSSHQVTDVNQSNGNPKFQHTAFTYDAYGDRISDDNTTKLTNDTRTYSYDGRGNIANVRGQYFTSGAWHFYDVASAFDAKNRRVYKSFYDETTAKTATWFLYYDAVDRLTEVRYTPDTSVSMTYSVFDLVWLDDKLVLYYETDFPGSTISRRYVTSDETDRPMQLWNWPSSGDATRVWAVNPSAWGFDTNVVGPNVYQPILFAGQYQDGETKAYENDGATIHRPGVALNGFRTYDPFVGEYLQVDPLVDKTWSTYLYTRSDPVGGRDPTGLCNSEDPSCDDLQIIWDDVGDLFGGGTPSCTGGCCDVLTHGCDASCDAEGGPSTHLSSCGCYCPHWTPPPICDAEDLNFGDITTTCHNPGDPASTEKHRTCSEINLDDNPTFNPQGCKGCQDTFCSKWCGPGETLLECIHCTQCKCIDQCAKCGKLAKDGPHKGQVELEKPSDCGQKQNAK
jgi:RHS repeat-associated protein